MYSSRVARELGIFLAVIYTCEKHEIIGFIPFFSIRGCKIMYSCMRHTEVQVDEENTATWLKVFTHVTDNVQ